MRFCAQFYAFFAIDAPFLYKRMQILKIFYPPPEKNAKYLQRCHFNPLFNAKY